MCAPLKLSDLLPEALMLPDSSMTATRQATLSNPNDLLSLVTQTDTTTINGKVFKTAYNAAQRQFTTTTPLNRSMVVTIDAQSRALTVQQAGILPVSYTYDARGRLASVSQGSGAAMQSLTYAYNPEGHVDSVTDALDRGTIGDRSRIISAITEHYI